VTNRLEMKVTISEEVTPALYQTMTSIVTARDRASMLKQLAEAYLCGKSIGSSIPSNLLLKISTAGTPRAHPAPTEKTESIPTTNRAESELASEGALSLAAHEPKTGYKLDVIGDQFAGF
jgi:hypothetical protein